MEKKSLSKAVSEFSKQYFRFKDSSSEEPKNVNSQNQLIQQKIDEVEELRKERIKKQYSIYENPVSQEIEEDEANLLKAYNLFEKISELIKDECDENTKIKDLKIVSPLCSKNEYVSGSGFAFLKVWFVKTQNNPKYIPEIVCEKEDRFLEFINADNYFFSNFEKEIFQEIN